MAALLQTATTFAELNADIQAADHTAANTSGTPNVIEIDISGAITDAADLTAINLQTGNTLLIKGVPDANGVAGTLDGGGA